MTSNDTSNAARPLIVVVDNEEDIRDLFQQELSKNGYDVQTFGDGASTLAYIEDKNNAKKVALFIIDRVLTEMDGMELVKKLAARPDNTAPIIMISALGQENDIVEGLQSGAADYITKPFSFASLIQKVRNLI